MSRKEGKLHKNERGRYELDEDTQFTCGSGIELKVCETWVKTRIEHDGTDYYAVGLRNLKLDGMTAREPRRVQR
ncbi:MAG: DUF5348 domain-containing protein [Firmicutes bacterium]|mgnify:FL=1|nr:DUF5348 domain-containing protein [Clostridia bacterium]MBS5023517.1 DUF5348 domain-containing protein [Bacillota bacterium]